MDLEKLLHNTMQISTLQGGSICQTQWRIQLRKETSVNLTEFPTPDSVFYSLNTF